MLVERFERLERLDGILSALAFPTRTGSDIDWLRNLTSKHVNYLIFRRERYP